MDARRTLSEGLDRQRRGDVEGARRVFRRAVEKFPKDSNALNLHGAAELQAGRTRPALRALRKAVAIAPAVAGYRYNLGLALRADGDLAAARAELSEAARLDPRHGPARFHLGTLMLAEGRAADAAALLGEAVGLMGEAPEALHNLGLALRGSGRPRQAVEVLRRAVAANPGYALGWRSLGVVSRELDDVETAATALDRALTLDPGDVEALAALAALRESRHALEDGLEIAARGLALRPDHEWLTLTAAKCESRLGREAEAFSRLAAMTRPESPDARETWHFLRARLADRLGDEDTAIAEMTAGKATQAAGWSPPEDHGTFRHPEDLRAFFERARPQEWPALAPAPNPPVFLIGFPRSGTTLLDQILDAHPGIQVLEEFPTIEAVRARLAETDAGYPAALPALGEDLAGTLRTVYDAAVAQGIARRPEALFVDKMPLNILDVGLILRVFPGARLILALRHPCDVCLSCFMQQFQLNPAMARFLTLKDAAYFYSETMALWEVYRRQFDPAVHVVRYEDLVEDLEREARAVLDFLGQPWDPGVLGFDAHARSRGTLRTPSAAQVTRPLFTHAKGRWHRYRRHLEPVLPILAPAADRLGYALD